MCGIAGIYNFDKNNPVSTALLRTMTDSLRHRGPDNDGYFVQQQIGLGFRRLSIIDLSPAGNQPISNEDGSVWIVFNGEIYNFRELRTMLQAKGHSFRTKTDTETIVHLYEEYGVDCLQHLNGMFAFALWDIKRQQLFLSRDRLGIKPLCYYQDGQRLLFGSEIKAILSDPSVPRELNRQALHDYLHYMSVPHPQTIYQDIVRVPAGHYVLVKNGSLSVTRYWDLPQEEWEARTDAYYLEELERRFSTAVKTQLVSDVPLGAFLSGGVDSSAVVAMMRKFQQEVKTFSITFKGETIDESASARQVSNHLGTEHREFNVSPDLIGALPKIVWHFDQPFAVASAFATYYLSIMTRSCVTVALSGDGGDELFAGYTYRLHLDRTLQKYAWLPLPLRKALYSTLTAIPAFGTESSREKFISFRRFVSYLANNQDDAYLQALTLFGEKEKYQLYERDYESLDRLFPSSRILMERYGSRQYRSVLQKRLEADIKTNLVDEMLTKVDVMSMAASLEVRVPFLDHTLVEFAMGIPDHLRLEGRQGKIILKRVMEKYLPASILLRQKQGFNVPVDRWFRRELAQYVRDILSPEALRRHGFFNPERVEQLIDRHIAHKGNYGSQLFALLSFQLWYDAFMVNSRG